MKFKLNDEEKSHHPDSRLARALFCDACGLPRLKGGVVRA